MRRSMIKYTRFGAGCLLSRPEVFLSRAEMLDNREIGHVQLMITPVPANIFQRNIETFEPYAGKIRIHAPHHTQGVNPCDPILYAGVINRDVHEHIEEAMVQTLEAADRTRSEIIILHAGRYQTSMKEEAINTFHSFIDQYPDNRYVIESLPNLQTGYQYLGITPDELKILGKDKITGYCPDFPHLWCTAQVLGIPYSEMLSGMSTLPLRFSHLSGSNGPYSDRQHLLFDDPENQFDHYSLSHFLNVHQDLEISLEFATDDPEVIRKQIRIASQL